jgi:hypothetical protein
MRVSIREAVGTEWGARMGIYDPEPLAAGRKPQMLRAGDAITSALFESTRLFRSSSWTSRSSPPMTAGNVVEV